MKSNIKILSFNKHQKECYTLFYGPVTVDSQKHVNYSQHGFTNRAHLSGPSVTCFINYDNQIIRLILGFSILLRVYQ
jgi:hypothetical protein